LAQQERAKETRRKLLLAAAEVFAEQGFSNATLSEIHTRAGMTKGALYFHFASKEEMAAAVVGQEADWYEEVDQQGPAVQSVIDLTHGYARALIHDVRIRATARLTLEETYGASDGAEYRAWAAMIAELLGEAKKSGDVRPEVDPVAMGEFVVGSFLGTQILSQVLSGRSDLEGRVTALWQALLPGLVVPHRLARFAPGGSARVWEAEEVAPGA